jgi:hypothetical protein
MVEETANGKAGAAAGAALNHWLSSEGGRKPVLESLRMKVDIPILLIPL